MLYVNFNGYCVLVTQADWPARLTRVIAGEVRRYRQERKMSAQQLADRCGALGMSIPRSVLANLESGRREAVSVAEVLVLAAALDVPPALLLFPVGRQDAIEILPRRRLAPWDALKWFAGYLELTVMGRETWVLSSGDHEAVVRLFESHDELRRRLARGPAIFRLLATEAPEEGAWDAWEMHEADMRALMELRQRMRHLGLIPPQLPEGWDDFDKPRDGGAH